MKRLLFILLLIPFLGYGQLILTPPPGFVIENSNVLYQNVFMADSLEKEVLSEKLMSYFSTFPGSRNIQKTGDLITGDIYNYSIDYRKYGGSWGDTWTMLNHPLSGKFTLQIKDGRYKLVISDMFFTFPPYTAALTDGVTKKKGTIFTSNSMIIQGMEYMDKDFKSKFQLTNSSLKSDW